MAKHVFISVFSKALKNELDDLDAKFIKTVYAEGQPVYVYKLDDSISRTVLSRYSPRDYALGNKMTF